MARKSEERKIDIIILVLVFGLGGDMLGLFR
jgi:hypothetical protein